MEALINCLPAILRSVGDCPEVLEAAAIAAWKHAVGEGLREHTVPVRLEDGRLIVSVADSVWQKQLAPMLGELLFRINRLLGQPVVSYIDLQIDPTLVNRHAATGALGPANEFNDVPLELYSAANAIADKELRQAFLRVALTQTRRLENP